MDVVLTPSELAMAAQVGCARHIEAIVNGLEDKHGADEGNGWQLHVEGACGEMALAKFLGVHWSGSVNTFKRGGDVGVLQVRTRSKHDYELIIRDSDDPKPMYWLVTGQAPRYRVHGFIRGHECKPHPEWRYRHGGREAAYFVPQSELHKPEEWK